MSNTKKADILFCSMVLIHMGVMLGFRFSTIKINISTNQSLILSQLLILTPVAIYLIITKTNPIKLIRFKRIDFATILMVILLTILIMPLITFVNALSMLYSENIVTNLSSEMTGNPFLVNLILMAVIPAISEEFVFRGVLFHTYRKSSVLYGAIISGIVFGLMHMNFNQFSYAFVLGIIFALILEATGSIFATMLAHFIINGNSVVLMSMSGKLLNALGQGSDQATLQSQMTPQYLMMVAAVYGMISIVTTALAIGVYIWLVKHCNRVNHMKAVIAIRTGENRFDIRKAISIWLIVGVIACVTFMFYYEINQSDVSQNSQVEQNIDSVEDNSIQIAPFIIS
ncbi:MAG: lysostaphin resistance A-like protein [Lachnotalea sp.]